MRWPLRSIIGVFLLASVGAVPSAVQAGDAPLPVSFEKEIRPLLTARCLGCHGGVTQKGGVDLRSRAAMLRGGKSGPALVPGHSADSLLWQAIADDRMPREEPKLADEEKQRIRRWIDEGAQDGAPAWKASTAAPRPPAVVAAEIDRLIDRHLRLTKTPASPAAEAFEFVRRVHLDVTGRIPTAAEIADFQRANPADRKRRQLDQLLASRASAEHFATLWHNAIVPLDLNRRFGNTAFLSWLADGFSENRGWDLTVRRILTAEGDTRTNPALGFYLANRRPALMGREATRIFLGTRLECAQCHDHPFAPRTQPDYWGVAAFFSRIQVKKETQPEVRYTFTEPVVAATEPASGGSMKIPTTGIRNVGREVPARYLDGVEPTFGAAASHHGAFAQWATSRPNRYFARATANRMWASFFGRGLVHPLDDLDGLDPARQVEVLDVLADEFQAANFDFRHLVRCICSTTAYERTARPVVGNADDTTGLSHMALKALSAEMLHDSLLVALAVKELAMDAVPIDPKALGADARTRFINLFNSQAAPDTPSYEHGPSQALRFMNGRPFQLTKTDLDRIAPRRTEVSTVVESLYLRTLGRLPSPREAERMRAHAQQAKDADEGFADVMWALLNSAEFLLNH